MSAGTGFEDERFAVRFIIPAAKKSRFGVEAVILSIDEGVRLTYTIAGESHEAIIALRLIEDDVATVQIREGSLVDVTAGWSYHARIGNQNYLIYTVKSVCPTHIVLEVELHPPYSSE